MALEIARTLGSDGTDGKLGFPESLRELVTARLAGLEPEVLEALLLAAALARPQVAAIQQALDGRDAAELRPRGRRDRDDPGSRRRVHAPSPRQRHLRPPLVPSAARLIAASSPSRLRRAAARHLALAATDAEPQVVAALDDAARDAQARGAPADAAELYELAIRLGAEQPRGRYPPPTPTWWPVASVKPRRWPSARGAWPAPRSVREPSVCWARSGCGNAMRMRRRSSSRRSRRRAREWTASR